MTLSRHVTLIAASALGSIAGHPREQFLAGSMAAGEEPTMYPEGLGNLLRAGTTLAGSMHYYKEPGPGTGVWDQSMIGFRFHPKGTEIKAKVGMPTPYGWHPALWPARLGKTLQHLPGRWPGRCSCRVHTLDAGGLEPITPLSDAHEHMNQGGVA